MGYILGIESTCDDSGLGVVRFSNREGDLY